MEHCRLSDGRNTENVVWEEDPQANIRIENENYGEL